MVTIECESGKIIELDCDDRVIGFGIIKAKKMKTS